MTTKKIINGTIVTSQKTFQADILIEDDRIKKIAPKIEGLTDEVIDAKEHYIFPGGVDIHTHFDMPFGGTVTSDDFFTGTIAAACGGTTTIIDFAIQQKGESLKQALENWHKKAQNKAVIDYGFHLALTDITPQIIEELPQIVDEGVSSIKVFMAYKDLMISDEKLFHLLTKSKELGILVMIHAEKGDLVEILTKHYLAQGKTAPIYHALSRPPEAEEEAVIRAITFVKLTQAPIYLVHLSTSQAVEKVQAARAEGLPVFAETCPQYLVLSMDRYSEPDFAGAKYVMSPPLRGKYNQDSLWKALETGSLQVVSSDHCSFNFKNQKELGRNNFALIPNGVPGVETRLYLLYSYGVVKKKISLHRLVDIFSTMPARIFGLYPRKGEIAEGSDADLVIFNPDKKFVLKAERLHQNVDYTPYEGMKISGSISVVLARGEVIYQNNRFVGSKSRGIFLKRPKWSDLKC